MILRFLIVVNKIGKIYVSVEGIQKHTIYVVKLL
jgi:hypothetical protein